MFFRGASTHGCALWRLWLCLKRNKRADASSPIWVEERTHKEAREEMNGSLKRELSRGENSYSHSAIATRAALEYITTPLRAWLWLTRKVGGEKAFLSFVLQSIALAIALKGNGPHTNVILLAVSLCAPTARSFSASSEGWKMKGWGCSWRIRVWKKAVARQVFFFKKKNTKKTKILVNAEWGTKGSKKMWEASQGGEEKMSFAGPLGRSCAVQIDQYRFSYCPSFALPPHSLFLSLTPLSFQSQCVLRLFTIRVFKKSSLFGGFAPKWPIALAAVLTRA